jgi:hypothetical protein
VKTVAAVQSWDPAGKWALLGPAGRPRVGKPRSHGDSISPNVEDDLEQSSPQGCVSSDCCFTQAERCIVPDPLSTLSPVLLLSSGVGECDGIMQQGASNSGRHP